MKHKPIRKSLKSSCLSRRDDTVVCGVNRSYSLKSSFIPICPSANCWTEALSIKTDRPRHFVFLTTYKLAIALHYGRVVPCSKAGRHQTSCKLFEMMSRTNSVGNNTFKSVPKGFRNVVWMLHSAPSVLLGLPIRINIGWQTFERLADCNLFNSFWRRKIFSYKRREHIASITYEENALAGCGSTVVARLRFEWWQYNIAVWHKCKGIFHKIRVAVIKNTWNILSNVEKRLYLGNKSKKMDEGGIALIFYRLFTNNTKTLAGGATDEAVKLTRSEPNLMQKRFPVEMLANLIRNMQTVGKVDCVRFSSCMIALDRGHNIKSCSRRTKAETAYTRKQVNNFRSGAIREKSGRVMPGTRCFLTNCDVMSHCPMITEDTGADVYKPLIALNQGSAFWIHPTKLLSIKFKPQSSCVHRSQP